MTDEELQLFIDLVYKHTGIKMHEGKRSLLINRLNRRLEELKIGSYREYYAFLNNKTKGSKEVFKFIDAVTTNETYFFRAPKIWDYFEKDFLINWQKENKKISLKIWCAASSSGEEPYTIGIICEEFARKHPGFQWQLKCSDISDQMLEKCKAAVYKGRSIEKISDSLLKRYFDGERSGEVTVKNELKNKISFFKHKLQDLPKYKGFDIIFLRNVMIYFDRPTKELVLKNMEQATTSNGKLIIGEAEGLLAIKHNFDYVQPSVYKYKK